jgi:multisubunit Na+/H+ antiporter MnhB subunit
MPWVSAGPFSSTGIDGDGVFTLLFGVAAGAIVLFRDWESVDVLGVGLLGALTVLVAANVYNNLGNAGGSTDVINVSAGFGLHLTLLAGLVLIAAAAQGYFNGEVGNGSAGQRAAGER